MSVISQTDPITDSFTPHYVKGYGTTSFANQTHILIQMPSLRVLSSIAEVPASLIACIYHTCLSKHSIYYLTYHSRLVAAHEPIKHKQLCFRHVPCGPEVPKGT